MTNDDVDDTRPVLVAVDGSKTVRVTLRHRGCLHTGEGDGDTPAIAAASATLDALDSLTPPAATFGLDWCGTVQTDDTSAHVVLVMATVTVAGVPMRQSGTAIIDGDGVPAAAARAVLDALNRRLEVMGI